jgi:hypothetical protein
MATVSMTLNPYGNYVDGAELNAYDSALTLKWSSSNPTTHNPTFALTVPQFNNSADASQYAAASFALPTVVNGDVYIPTSGITYYLPSGATTAVCTTSSPCSGLVVYCYTTSTACSGHWQQ